MGDGERLSLWVLVLILWLKVWFFPRPRATPTPKEALAALDRLAEEEEGT